MPFVASFTNITPPSRHDGYPWSTLVFTESPAIGGVYTTIDSTALVPLDTNPSVPMTRNFTTTLATSQENWFKLKFQDAVGGEWIMSPRKSSGTSASWFSHAELVGEFPLYKTLALAEPGWVDGTLIPGVVSWILGYVHWSYDAIRHKDLVGIAKRYTVNKILASDETVAIARARGQTSFTVAGETISLDLTQGRNFWLTAEDQLLLDEIRGDILETIHTDKIAVRGDGPLYSQPPPAEYTDYTIPDYLTS